MVVHKVDVSTIAGPVAPLEVDAGLQSVKEPQKAEEEGTTEEDLADLDESKDSPRVVFVPARLNREDFERSVVEGPPWEFHVVGLPAISEDGERLVVYQQYPSLGWPIPNLTLMGHLVRDDTPVEIMMPPLSIGSFLNAKKEGIAAGDPEKAFNKLAADVQSRVREVNKELRNEAFGYGKSHPLEPCTSDGARWFGREQNGEHPDPNEPEHINCPGAKIVYHSKESKFDVTFKGRTFAISRPDWVVPRPTPDGINFIELRTSLFGAIDRKRELFVLRLDPMCLRTKECRRMASVWHVLPLRRSPRK